MKSTSLSVLVALALAIGWTAEAAAQKGVSMGQKKTAKSVRAIQGAGQKQAGGVEQQPGPATASIFDDDSFSRYQELNPRARFYKTPFYAPGGTGDEASTYGAIYGTVLNTGSTPFESAWNHIHEVEMVLGKDLSNLKPKVQLDGDLLQGAMFDHDTGTHRFQVFRFEQTVGGIPVFRSGVGFLVRNEANYPLVMAGYTVKDLGDFAPAGGAPVVTDAMLANVKKFLDDQPREQSLLKPTVEQPIDITDEELVVYAGNEYGAVDPETAVVFIAERGSVQTLPDYQKYMFVASVDSGEILLAETQIHEFTDVNGSVEGRATQGLASLECDPEVAVPLPYARVSIDGGNAVFADENGLFNIPHGGNTQVTVRSPLQGQWFEVRDQAAGNSIPELTLNVTPPGPADFLHNPTANQQFPTANVNAYVESNIVRDFTLQFEPTFPVINNQQFFDINTNINSSCNAFYNGSSINFYRSGGGCNNTSFSDVVHHEYGHHLIAVSGNGQGQMGEGTGDTMGVLIQDDPILGQGFTGNCNAGIRNANNNHQYPCNGAIHDCGQLISGCVWSTRNELIVTEPSDYLMIGGQLFVSMLVVRGQMEPGSQTITPAITIYYLELDDDDGDIGNGTPHYFEIATGFGAHNMDAPPLELLDFDYPNGRPDLISPGGGVAFTVEVSALSQQPQPGTGVLYIDRGNGLEVFPMNEQSPNVYEANFPATSCGTGVTYYVSADSTQGSTVFDPADAPATTYSATYGNSLDSVFHDDFQSNMGWTVSGDAGDGQWQRGTPAGGGDRGDPPTDGDGSGQCYVTDNADGNSDVDDGSTILTSPVMDASGAGEAYISYYRWYSNDFGNAPFSDIFVVEISNNGGSTWTNLETVGPGGNEVSGGWFHKTFRISDFVTPTNNMRIRFNASDLGDGSVVEAGVDGVDISLLSCGSVQVNPVSANTLLGNNNQGGVGDLADSDDSDMCIVAGAPFSVFSPSIIMEAEGVLPSDSPTSLSVKLEASVNDVGITQTIEMYNFDTASYEVVDTRAASQGSDSVADVALGGDVTRFAEAGTGTVRARISYTADGSQVLLGWEACIDQLIWTFD